MERFFNTAGPNCEEEQSTIHNSAKDELQPQMAWECGLPAYLQHDLNQLFRFPALARHATGIRSASDQFLPCIQTLDYKALVDSTPYLSSLQRRFFMEYLDCRSRILFQ